MNENEKPTFKGEILLCEDSEINQHVIKTHLNKVGLSVVIANNGKEGVDVVSSRVSKGEKPFDLIFMDMQMPVMDGMEAAELIIKMGVKTPIVALTANALSSDCDIYAAHGMPRCLGKPFTTEQLWACLYEYFKPLGVLKVSAEERSSEEEKQRVKLYSSFVRRNQTTYEDICNALDAGDVKLAHRLAHTLRGLAGLMSKKELQEAARVVETELAGGSSGGLKKEDLEKIGFELKKVLDELAPYMEQTDQKAAVSWDKKAAKELFDKIEPLLKDDNPECLKFTDALRAFPGTNELITQLDDFEFESALETMAGLRKTLEE